MSKSTIRRVTFKTDEQRDRLVDEYIFLGYYVKIDGNQVVVNSRHPKKKKDDKKVEKATDRPRRKFDKRSEER